MKKKNILIIAIATIFLSSCSTYEPIKKSVQYKGIYDEKPLGVLIMPPINKSTNVDAKQYLHSTLNVPLVNSGYYVLPPFLTMEILQRESAYDAELFLDAPLNKFGEIFGADVVLFTTITRWDKQAIAAKINIEVEYVLKSTKTNEILYKRKGFIVYDASVNSGNSNSLAALAVNMIASAINTAVIPYVDIARQCNGYTLQDVPKGKYDENFGLDGEEMGGKPEFSVTLNSKSRY